MTSTVSAAAGSLLPWEHRWFREEGQVRRQASPRLSGARVHALLCEETEGAGDSQAGSALPAGPLVLPRRSYEELFHVSRVLLALVRRAVLAQGDGWPARLAAFGLEAADHPLLSGRDNTETEHCAMAARADFVIGQRGPQLLGFDAGGAFDGPVRAHGLSRAWRRAYAADGAAAVIVGADPLACRAEAFAEVCARRSLPKAVALVGPPDDRATGVACDRFRHAGFTADCFEPRQLPEALGRPGALRYPLGLLTTAVHGGGLQAVLRAQRAGLLLLPPQSSALLADDRALALVSEQRPWMTRAERRLVERHLPWTRITLPGRTWWREGEYELPALLLRERERFVLKPGPADRGRGAVIGRHSGPSAWEEAVGRAFTDGDGVVQEYVEPQPCALELTDGTATWTARILPVLSPMLFNGRAGGCLAQFAPDGTAAAPEARTGTRTATGMVDTAVLTRP
ncbi:hypothetical protein QCN29_18750 [Streptomyces sp. HNM0663]|uniref:ATP-grasp domain-containing protein n=1 Tax=Streptomyces chengmaiensis TaxID=3040919 RepID=A0ABT6HPZ7_9ACTN|nr:hypothetical protein [Streptomyces chengmaiensis]MDH2390792.1 hypothetical protein [Streptomyces chengmaiensis]